MTALLALLLAAAPDAGAPPEPALAQIKRLGAKLEPHVAAPWVKAWVRTAQELEPVAPRTWYCRKDRSGCVEEAPKDLTGFVRRDVDDAYFYARITDPLGYARAFDVLARHGFSPNGRKVLDFGYGNAGQLLMLAKLGADVHGIEVDPVLPLAYAGVVGAVKGKGAGRLAVHHGFFAKDAALVKEVGGGYDLFLSKNTLKRGYVHPEEKVPDDRRIDLGLGDDAFLAQVFGMLKPGGLFFIYNLAPAPAPPGKPFVQAADGRTPFSREAYQKAGFEVLAFDAVDDEAARAMARVLEWDKDPESPMDVERELFAKYTLARRPLPKK